MSSADLSTTRQTQATVTGSDERLSARPEDDLTRVVGVGSTGADDATRIARTEGPREIDRPAGVASSEEDQATRVVGRGMRDSPTRLPDASNPGGTFATLAPIRSEADTFTRDANATDETAKQVGRYLVMEKLGRGGMATVFRAHDPSIGRDVAIKFLHSTLCEDDEYRGRFLREARAAGGLSHPNIVTVYDVGEIDGRPYMAMELLRGQPLAEQMDAGKMLPVRDVVIIGMQLARALDYAHSRGIVHRDIKPGNIAVLEGTNTIKVMDFGIAHMDVVGAAEQHTRVGDVLGTPQYMSPEQTRGEKLDGRSDLFSVGIMLYQMLAGQRPFQGGSMVAVAMKIAQEQPPGLDRLRPDAPAALRRIVERCLAKAPDQRFQTGRELSDALGRVLTQIDQAARQREQPRVVSLRLKWAAVMALIVAIVMGLTASIVTQRQYAAMMSQVSDNGAALARFIAAQNAEAALAGDQWLNVQSRIKSMMETGDVQSIRIVDSAGMVRASSDDSLVDQRYRAPPADLLEKRANGIELTRRSVDGEPILGVEAPITFTDQVLGRVYLGLRERPLVRVAQLSMTLMAVLIVVTVLAVAITMYIVAHWFAKPIKTATDALDEIAAGHLDHRIAEARKDEFGLLFAAFDRMAQTLQDARSGVATGSASTTTPTAMPTRAPVTVADASPPVVAPDTAPPASDADDGKSAVA